MSTQTTSNLTNPIGTRYTQRYQRGAKTVRLYDQLAGNIKTDSQFNLEQRRGMGTTYTFNFLSGMTPSVTAVSETSDLVPQIVRDAVSTITPTSRMDGLKWTELLDLEVYTDYAAARFEILGQNMMESVEALAISAALGGSLVDRTIARASLDAGTATHLWTDKYIWRAATLIKDLQLPAFMVAGQKKYIAIAHPDAYYDLFSGGNILSATIYGGLPGQILLNGELGELADFKLIISPFAKVFGGAGSDNGTNSDYTLSSAAEALALTLSIGTATNVASGRLLTIGTEETSTTFYPDNERVKHISGTTTSTIVGSGSNGGIKYDHASGASVRNADSVYPVAYGNPWSLAKVYAEDVGEFGKIVSKTDGLVNQWQSLAWKFYGGYGRVAENRILRGEYASSLDA